MERFTDRFVAVIKRKVHPWLIYLLCIIIAIGLMMLVWMYFGERIRLIEIQH